MFIPAPDEDPLPHIARSDEPRDRFDDTCSYLDRQCDGVDRYQNGVWKGVDVNGITLQELPTFFGSVDRPYDGPFLQFCNKAVKKGKYKRFGAEDNVFNLRLKIVADQDDFNSLTILLQHEYIGYDVSIESGAVVLRRTGHAPETLTGERAGEILDDIEYVASRLVHYSYQTQASSRIETCDLPVLSVISEVSENKPMRNLAKRAFGRLLI